MFVRSLVLILVSGLLYSVSADYNNNEDHEGYNQEQRYQVAGYVDPDLKPEPFLSAKEPDEDKIYKNSRLVEAAFTLGFLYFTYNMFRPNNLHLKPIGRETLVDSTGRFDGNDDYGLPSDLIRLVIDRINPVEKALNYLQVPSKCHQRAVCEARAIVATVPIVNDFATDNGWLIGNAEEYQASLKDGRSLINCSKNYGKCENTPFSQLYSLFLK